LLGPSVIPYNTRSLLVAESSEAVHGCVQADRPAV